MTPNFLTLSELLNGLQQSTAHLVLTAREFQPGKMESMFSKFGDRSEIVGALTKAMQEDDDFIDMIEEAVSNVKQTFEQTPEFQNDKMPLSFNEEEVDEITGFVKECNSAIILTFTLTCCMFRSARTCIISRN